MQNRRQVYLATDHAGFELKEAIKTHLDENGFPVNDLGAHAYDPADDYPSFMHAAAKAVAESPHEACAIIFGGSGQGEAIVANRYAGVRAVVYNTENLELITLSREHNDANVLSIGARFVSEAAACEAVDLWLKTPFSGDERHVRRISQIDNNR